MSTPAGRRPVEWSAARVRVLVADQFERSGLDGLAAIGCDVVHDPALKDEALAAALARDAGGGAGRPLDQGDRGDDGRRAPRPHRPRGRRLQHDRRRRRVGPRHLRLELPGPERGRRGRARVRPDPRARPADPGQRRRPAGRPLEQAGVREGPRPVRHDARAAGVREHRPGAGAPRPGVRLQPRHLGSTLRGRPRPRPDAVRPRPPSAGPDRRDRVVARRGRRAGRHPQRPPGARIPRPEGSSTRTFSDACGRARWSSTPPGPRWSTTTALADAVRERGIRVGLDVYPNEPTTGTAAFDDPLVALPGVYGTHHIGASTDQAQEAIAAEVVRIVASFSGHGPGAQRRQPRPADAGVPRAGHPPSGPAGRPRARVRAPPAGRHQRPGDREHRVRGRGGRDRPDQRRPRAVRRRSSTPSRPATRTSSASSSWRSSTTRTT